MHAFSIKKKQWYLTYIANRQFTQSHVVTSLNQFDLLCFCQLTETDNRLSIKNCFELL